MISSSRRRRYAAAVRDIPTATSVASRCLVGTTSIENSVDLGDADKEDCRTGAQRQAARKRRGLSLTGRSAKMITIATNMAGRGTGVVLIGALELEVIAPSVKTDPLTPEAQARRNGSSRLRGRSVMKGFSPPAARVLSAPERHGICRIDNQFACAVRSRVTGSSCYLSAEDLLIRIFMATA